MSDAFVAIVRPLRGGAPLLQAPLPPSSLCSFAYFASFVVNKEKSKSGNRERREKGQAGGFDYPCMSDAFVAIVRPFRGGAPLLQAPPPPSSPCSFAYFASFVVNKEKSKSGNRERREKGQAGGFDYPCMSDAFVAIVRPLRGGAPLLQAPLPPSSLCSFAYFVVNKEKSKSGNRERREKGQAGGFDYPCMSYAFVAI